MITLAPWDHHVLTVWNCVHQWFGNGGKMHCWLGLMGGTPALQQKNSFHFVHLTLEACVDMSMLIGEKTVKRKGTTENLTRITLRHVQIFRKSSCKTFTHLSMWPSDSFVPKSIQPHRKAQQISQPTSGPRCYGWARCISQRKASRSVCIVG